MKSRKRTTLFKTPKEQKKLFPSVTGNEINGVGEQTVRPPTKIFWGQPKELVHAELQAYVGRKFRSHPVLGPTIRGEGEWDRGPKVLDPVAGEKRQTGAVDNTRDLKAFALEHEADLVGIARYDPMWTFDRFLIALIRELGLECLSPTTIKRAVI